jgi:hypothetical protein
MDDVSSLETLVKTMKYYLITIAISDISCIQPYLRKYILDAESQTLVPEHVHGYSS